MAKAKKLMKAGDVSGPMTRGGYSKKVTTKQNKDAVSKNVPQQKQLQRKKY